MLILNPADARLLKEGEAFWRRQNHWSAPPSLPHLRMFLPLLLDPAVGGLRTRASGPTIRRWPVRLAGRNGVPRRPIPRRGAYRIDRRPQTRGLKPVCRVKTRLKWLWSAKPQAKAISESDGSGWRIR